jgi:hemerythrin-like domain-containing protein
MTPPDTTSDRARTTAPEVLLRLQREHADIARLLKVLERQLETLRAGAEARFELVGEVLRYIANFPNLAHHPKEDLVYERLVLRDPASAALIGDMRVEHAQLDTRTQALVALITRAAGGDAGTGEVAGALAGFVDSYWRHMTIEEETLFPRAWAVLTEADWLEIDAAIVPAVDPLFGEAVAAQYARLRDAIIRHGA